MVKTKPRNRLKRERESAGLTQIELQNLSGVSQSFISRLETDSVSDAAFGILELLAQSLRRMGRTVQAGDLRPSRQPVLVKGVFAQPKRRRKTA
jgi:transcriptional regulator with XRE-family HTH domain